MLQLPFLLYVDWLADTYPRLEIRNLLGNFKWHWQRDLFLQAFSRLLSRPAKQANSFFQIAAIHGLPYEAYDGVSQPNGFILEC